MYKKYKFIIWAIIFIIFIFGMIIWSKKLSQEKINFETSRDVAMACTTDMATEYHIHPLLTIIINGTEIEIPTNIGITPVCMMSIHTHDATGIIHVEAPVVKDFILADFFAVWQKPFSKDQILDYKISDTAMISMTVNGKIVDTFENTLLRDKDEIVITYTDTAIIK